MADDEIHGDSGNNIFFGGNGEDILAGHGGNDALFGGHGEDALLGGKGDDFIVAGKGEDFVRGGAGNDRISGGKGEDDLRGGAGADKLAGGKGDDMLTGGLDADTFVFAAQGGEDVITDFSQADGDKLDVTAFGFDDISDVAITGTNGGADTLVTLEGGTSVVLIGVDHTSLTAADFNFA